VRIEFNGSSWGLGALCAAVYFGHVSPWWLVSAPLFLWTSLLPFYVVWTRH
jgi:hypothetical protein